MPRNGGTRKLWLRNTLFAPGREPVTMVMSETDLKVPIYVAANQMRQEFGESVDIEVFEWDAELISASAEAARRAAKGRRPLAERNRDVLHDYMVSMLYVLAPGGVTIPRRPAPLDAEAVKEVLEKVAQHEEYKRQRMLILSEDGKMVTLDNGRVTITEGPRP